MTDDMHLDARVRGALQDLPMPSEPETAQALRAVLDHRRPLPRRAAMWAPLAAAAAVVIIAVLIPLLRPDSHAGGPAPVAVSPTVLPGVEGTWWHDVSGATDASWNGRWVMTLNDRGVMALVPPSRATQVSDGAAYAVSGEQIRVNAFVNDLCSEMPAGVFGWARAGDRLMLVPISEPCPDRKDLFTGAWSKSP